MVEVELAILSFEHAHGAESAFAGLTRHDDAPWWRELAFVERHKHGRVIIHGTFAGHYLDIDERGDVIGPDTGIGVVAGAVAGAPLGPPGFAAGMVVGGSIGGYMESEHATEHDDHHELFEQIRVHVPVGSSGIMLLAVPEDVDAMLSAFADAGGHAFRRPLTEEQADVLRSEVATAPPAAPPMVVEEMPDE